MVTDIDLGMISHGDTYSGDITVSTGVEELVVRLITEGAIRILVSTLLDPCIALILLVGPREADTAALVGLQEVGLGGDTHVSPLFAVIEATGWDQPLILTNLGCVTLGFALRTFSPFRPFLLELRIICRADSIDSLPLSSKSKKTTLASMSFATSPTLGLLRRVFGGSCGRFEQIFANPRSMSLQALLPLGQEVPDQVEE